MRRAWAMISISLDRRDVLVLVGLLLIAIGGWFVFWPAAFFVPGAVLVWYALPSRPPFIEKGNARR